MEDEKLEVKIVFKQVKIKKTLSFKECLLKRKGKKPTHFRIFFLL